MKLGLTTTSRRVPLQAAPAGVRTSTDTNAEADTAEQDSPQHEDLCLVRPMLPRATAAPRLSAMLKRKLHLNVGDEDCAETASAEEPLPRKAPRSRRRAKKNDKLAPRSAVRRKASGLRSGRSMRGPLPPSRTTGRSGPAATNPVTDSTQAASPRKKERNAAETKRRILEAAAAEFAAKGFDGARLGTIARSAGVQQALIHHYFVDKEGLHTEVVRGGLAAMTEDAWNLLAQMDAPVAGRKGKKRRGPAELEALAEGFVDLLLGFFATNGAFLSILRHEARRDAEGNAATKIVADNVAPVFDAIVARLDELRARGEVRKDVDARHLVLSCVAMIAFPFQEEPFVSSIWPVDWRRPEHLAERKRHVVEMILARVLP